MHISHPSRQNPPKHSHHLQDFCKNPKKCEVSGKYGFSREEDQELVLDHINDIIASEDSTRKTELFEQISSVRWDESSEPKLIGLISKLISSDAFNGLDTFEFLFDFINDIHFQNLNAQMQLLNDIKDHVFSEDPRTLHFLGHLICKFNWSLNETRDEVIRLICMGPFLKSYPKTLAELFQFIPQWCKTEHAQVLFARTIQSQAFGTEQAILIPLRTAVRQITWENQHAFNIVSKLFPEVPLKLEPSQDGDSSAFTLTLPSQRRTSPCERPPETLDLSGYHSTITIRPHHVLDKQEAFLTIHREESYAFQYQTRTEFCKNILAIFPERRCIHIVSYDAFSSKKLSQILDENPGDENIIYHFWNSNYQDKLSHVSNVYIDRKTKNIFYLPDTFSQVLATLPDESQLLQKLGYQLCLPAGTFFTGGVRKSLFDTMQQDNLSCSFLALQSAQKIERMQKEGNSGSLIALESLHTLLRDQKTIVAREQGKAFDYNLDEEKINPSIKSYLVPSAFYGLVQRTGFMILNEALLRIYSSQGGFVPESPTAVQVAEKNARRALWTRYFNLSFENDENMSKYEKTVKKLFEPEGFQVDYAGKTSALRKIFDPLLSQLSEENKDDAIQMAKDVHSLLGVLPTREFFSAIKCRNPRMQQEILDKITTK